MCPYSLCTPLGDMFGIILRKGASVTCLGARKYLRCLERFSRWGAVPVSGANDPTEN